MGLQEEEIYDENHRRRYLLLMEEKFDGRLRDSSLWVWLSFLTKGAGVLHELDNERQGQIYDKGDNTQWKSLTIIGVPLWLNSADDFMDSARRFLESTWFSLKVKTKFEV